MAAISSANTMAKPASLPTGKINSTGSKETIERPFRSLVGNPHVR